MGPIETYHVFYRGKGAEKLLKKGWLNLLKIVINKSKKIREFKAR